MCLTRSSVESEKMDEADTLRAAFELIGAEVKFTGGYPGWTPRPDSKIVQLMSAVYKELFQEEAQVLACHAGLECGIIGRNYPGMEMISFGPYHTWCALPGRTGEHPFGREVLEVPAGGAGEAVRR
jgi:dipeptidase D